MLDAPLSKDDLWRSNLQYGHIFERFVDADHAQLLADGQHNAWLVAFHKAFQLGTVGLLRDGDLLGLLKWVGPTRIRQIGDFGGREDFFKVLRGGRLRRQKGCVLEILHGDRQFAAAAAAGNKDGQADGSASG